MQVENLSVLASLTKHPSEQRVTSSFVCICQIFEDIKQATHVYASSDAYKKTPISYLTLANKNDWA